MIALKLDRVISQVCPIYGVSIGNSSDRLTWRFHPREEATPAQIQDASRAVESFVYSTVLTDEEKVIECTSRLDDKTQRLLFEINFDQENRLRALEGKPAITKTQYRDALINVWKGLA